jgi:tRNA/rRNA methyltransferase
MGLSDLVIAAPRTVDLKEARMMACSADKVLESRREFPTLLDAVADCSLVVGTSARLGLYRQHAMTAESLPERILEASASGPVAIVFGPEDNGLSNDDLEACSTFIRIPTSTEYSSLNLSQAVLIVCYEIFKASGVYEHIGEKSELASAALKERMYEMWEEMLLDIGFMEKDKAAHMMLGIRRIFSRGEMTEDDVRILMGVARQSQWAAAHEPRQATSDSSEVQS